MMNSDEAVSVLEAFQRVAFRQHYSVAHMTLFIQLVLSASASLRCASQALGLFFSLLSGGLSCSAPSWVCGRFWLLRLGYYKLKRRKEMADDWVWIVDHSIQLGARKCLVILGIRLSKLPVPLRSLRYEDMEPIELLPVDKSNGKLVYQQLEKSLDKTGVPRQIVADEGADLKKGIELFCQTHAATVFTYDIKHKTAAVLKHELAKDETWQEFKSLLSKTKQKIQQSSLAFLCPRNHRTKSRYMNADILIEWGLKALHVLAEFEATQANQANQEGRQDSGAEWKTLKEQIGWVREFRAQLNEWAEMMHIIAITEHMVRTEGLYQGVSETLKTRLGDTGLTIRTQRIRAALIDFVAEASSDAKPDEILVGSSEVLESLFGKFKHLEGEQSKSGFTSLVLSIPAMVSDTTGEIIQQAIEAVSTKNVLAWCKKHIGKSVQAKKKETFTIQGKKEQKWEQLLNAG